MEKGPVFENFDLDIKNDEEMKEAKKVAGIKSKKERIEGYLEHAVETTDEKLFDNALEFEKKSSLGEKVFDVSINAMIIDKIEEQFSNLINKETKEKYTNRLKVIFDEMIGRKNTKMTNEESAVEILEQATEKLLEEIKKEKESKKYKGEYVVNKDGTVATNIREERKNALR